MRAEPPPTDKLPPDDAISHQASRWFALSQGGSPTQAERAALAAWLAADPRHRAAYGELEQLWAITAQLHPAQPAAAPALSRRRFVGLGIAASVVAVTAGTSALWLSGTRLAMADIRTAVGERRTATLADGSTVDMAGNTALNVDFAAGRRSVELLQGEAYFNVVPSTGGEFEVTTPYGQITAAEGEFCLSCERASVLLAVSRKTASVVAANQHLDLGEGLSLRFSQGHAGPIQHAELEQILAWRSGRLVFFDTPLRTVTEQLQRWRPGRIFVMDEQLAARRVSLILNLERPDQLIDALTSALSVRARHYTDLVTLIYPA